MTFSLILFYVLAAIVLFGALKTVTAKNPVHASLYLVLTFCVSAMIWMLMQAEFLGITLVLVYVGAVMVLFLFVVMMLRYRCGRNARRLLAPCAGGRPRRHADGGGADSDFGQPENQSGRFWPDEGFACRLQQYPRFGQPDLHHLPTAV